jgi:hypothetical protein
VEQLPLNSDANARRSGEAGGWTALELTVVSLALALAALFAVRAWLQRTAHRGFGA